MSLPTFDEALSEVQKFPMRRANPQEEGTDPRSDPRKPAKGLKSKRKRARKVIAQTCAQAVALQRSVTGVKKSEVRRIVNSYGKLVRQHGRSQISAARRTVKGLRSLSWKAVRKRLVSRVRSRGWYGMGLPDSAWDEVAQ